MTTEILIKEFNHLGGMTIQDHKRNFFLYMKKLGDLAQQERQHILNNLRAEHRQEEIFIVKVLLKFEQIDNLKTVILRGDRVLNKLITAHKPFVFRGENADYFLNELFPNASFIVRHKCLNNLTKTIIEDHLGEEFFKRTLQMYGIKTAQILLPCCSESFTKKILTQYRVIFRDRQMVMLHQRFGLDLILFYYAECANYGLICQFEDQPFFARHLSTNDIPAYYQLLTYGMPAIGKCGFKNFMKAHKDEFLKDSKTYLSLGKPKLVYRLLTMEEYRTYLLNKCPESAGHFNANSFVNDLKPVNIKYRGSLLFGIFEEKYGYNLNMKYCSFRRTENRLKDILSVEDMLKFDLEDDAKLEYLPPLTSFPMIKERINLTADMNERRQLLLKLFRCAKNNSDDQALLEALKYFNHRHKNDQSLTRFDVLTALQGMYKMEKLPPDVWEILHEWIQLELLTGEEVNKYQRLLGILYDELKYNFENGLECMPIFKLCIKAKSFKYFKFSSTNQDLRRWFLIQFPEVAVELFFADAEALKRWPGAFLGFLHDWNRDYPKKMISYYKYPEILELAFEYHNVRFYYFGNLFGDILVFPTKEPKERKLQDELLDRYMSKFSSIEALWFWLLKHRIGMVEKHFELYFDSFSAHENSLFLYEISKMHYTLLSDKFRTKSLQLLNESIGLVGKKDSEKIVTSTQRNIALVFLSHQQYFMDIINNDMYYSSGEAEVNIIDELSKETFRLREQVLKCLRNRPCSEEVIPILMRFCFKDYFNTALPVLTVVLYNLPEKDLVTPLHILQDRSVSVRKKAIFFGTSLGTALMSCKTLRNAVEHEKNQSLLKFIINRTFKNFCSLGNEQSWELLKDHFKFVFEKDKETLNMVLQFNLIPRIYLPEYIAKVWYSVGKLWENAFDRVLRAIKVNIIPLLTDDLCDDIINFHLRQSKEWVSSDVDFIYTYLLSGGEKMDHRLDLVAKNTGLVSEDSEVNLQELSIHSRNVCFMYKDICLRLMLENEGTLDDRTLLANKLAEKIPDLPLPYNRLDYQMQIEICRCYLNDRSALPELFIKLQREILDEHGDAMQEYFNDFVESQNICLYDVDSRLNFVQSLLELDHSRQVKLLAIRLLPDDYPPREVSANKWLSLIQDIRCDATPLVELFMNRYLKNVNVDYSIYSRNVRKSKRFNK